tara:strand:+ start:14175 stop:14516 length:342 start_codon:yes stop_codon:yes gene_type:complete
MSETIKLTANRPIPPQNSTGINYSLDAQEDFAIATEDWALLKMVHAVKVASKTKSQAKQGTALLEKSLTAALAKVVKLERQIADFDHTGEESAQDKHDEIKADFRAYVRETQG